jgi:Icc-related predicted phosphoesterase
MTGLVRVAAVGDVHMDVDVLGRFRPALGELGGCADMLLLAGDLTRHGTPEEAKCVATEFAGLDVPVVAVLGNHDHHSDRPQEVTRILSDAGITVLEGETCAIDVDGVRVSIAGATGFGGGFAGRCVSEFGEPQTKAFARYGAEQARRLATALEAASGDVRIALTHYAPVPETLVGEPPEIYPFLGSFLLAEAVDAAGAALSLHGHAHAGSPCGTTPGGVPVRNVAHPVIDRAYALFHLDVDPAVRPGADARLPALVAG